MRIRRSLDPPDDRVSVGGRWSIRPSRTGLWLTGVFLFCFFYFLPRPADWNQNARLDLTLALVNRHAITIDEYRWNTGIDSVLSHGHYYANKAPGQSLAGIPIYAGVRALFTAEGGSAIADRIGLARWWHKYYNYYFLIQCLESMYTVAVPAVLFLMLFFWFLQYFTTSLVNRVVLTLGLGLGTSIFAYSQVFYPHVPAASLLFTAFVVLYVMSHPDARRESRAVWLCAHPAVALLLAGFALGLALLYDHTSAIVAAFIGLYALTRVPLRMIPLIGVGAAPFVMAAGAYDLIAYHSATVTGYNVAGVGSGVGGTPTTWPPKDYGLFGITFSPYRGLFFLSPFLMMAIPGCILWSRRGGREWLLCLAAPACFTVAISTVSVWPGGVAVGPRYLIPIIPFLALPVIFVFETARTTRARLALYALVAASIALTWIETLGGKGYPPVTVPDPIFSYSLPALAQGHLPLSLGTIVTAPMVGLNSQWSLLPLALALSAWSLYCFRPRPARKPHMAAVEALA